MDLLLAELLPVLALFYVVEGLILVRPFQRVLVSRALGGGYALLRPGLGFLGAAPWQVMAAVQTLPGVVGPDGFHAIAPNRREEPPVIEPGDLQLTPFEALGAAVADHRKIRCGGQLVAVAATPEDASRFAGQLRAIATAREDAAVPVEVEAVRARWRESRPLLGALRVVTTLAWLGWFGLLPAAITWPERFAFDVTGLLWVVVSLHLLVPVVAAVAMAHGEVPGGKIASVVTQLLILPSSAARASFHVSRQLLRFRHPSEVAALLLAEQDFVAMARRELARIDFSAERTASLGAGASWDRRAEAWKAALRQCGIRAEALSAGPPTSTLARRYCRVCEAEYADGQHCSDCRVPLAEVPRAAA